MKEREIFELYKLQGIEGDRNDDWQLIDCHEFLVHLMLPGTSFFPYLINDFILRYYFYYY